MVGLRKRILGTLFLATAAATGRAFTITPTYQNLNPTVTWTDDEMAVVNQAITDWTSHVAFADGNTQDIPVTFKLVSAGTGPGAFLTQWSFNQTVLTAFPYSPGITHTISLNTDFLSVDSFSLDGPVVGEYDILTAMEHEIGHMLGFAPGVYDTDPFSPNEWNVHLSSTPDGLVFDAGGLNVPMNPDGAHVDLPDDLMYTSLGGDTRRAISETDLDMLALAYGYTITPVPEAGSLMILVAGSGGILLRRRIRSLR